MSQLDLRNAVRAKLRELRSVADQREARDAPRRVASMSSNQHEKEKARGRVANMTCQQRHKKDARRAKRRSSKHTNGQPDQFDRIEIFIRDGFVCGVCGDQVDETLLYPDPMSPSIDHVIPLSKGGSHTLDNVQCTHLDCNLRKGAGMVWSEANLFGSS